MLCGYCYSLLFSRSRSLFWLFQNFQPVLYLFNDLARGTVLEKLQQYLALFTIDSVEYLAEPRYIAKKASKVLKS